MPRRIAMVVDRRVVVDDAARRAGRIRDALVTAKAGILSDVASSLRLIGGEVDEPLHVAVLRGGLYRENRWARTPVQPTILLSTVDQVGSRLLFRGYGVSSEMWPIHAGLLANDCLIILDEAHVSQPFMETLEWIRKYRGIAAQPLNLPFAFVPMTATPPQCSEPFRLDDTDRGNEKLRQRLNAVKAATLVAGKSRKDVEFAKELLEEARKLFSSGKTVAIVANRVATARAVFEQMQKEDKDRLSEISELEGRLAEATDLKKRAALETRIAGLLTIGQDAILLTGRSRSFERDQLLEKWRHRIAAGRSRTENATARPLVVVATQCIEVGADFDFDALVTECAPLDALRQRFGRLDRLGELGDTEAAIIAREDAAVLDGECAEDPVYEKALAKTWRWLNQKSQTTATMPKVDFSVTALDSILPQGDALTALLSPPVHAPVIFPAYCDLWAQTNPAPVPTPEPSIFLHGPQRGEPEVQIVWRADIDPENIGTWVATIAKCPPVAAESLSIRMSVARSWLTAAKYESVEADLEGLPIPEVPWQNGMPLNFKTALRWRGPEDSFLAESADDLRPGDLLVVPASYGGCDEFGWNPGGGEPVPDIAERVQLAVRRRAVLRLHPSMAATWGSATKLLTPLCLLDGKDDDVDFNLACQAPLAAVAASDSAHEWLKSICSALERDRRRSLLPHPSGIGWVLTGSFRLAAIHSDSDFSDEDSQSVRIGRDVSLTRHANDVKRLEQAFTANLGLPNKVADDLVLSAFLHDLGKADPRFQTWLCGGDRIAALRAGVLAKSANISVSPAARKKSGYPEGGRHELLTVRMAESSDSAVLKSANNRDLVLHLLASHHGRCRCFAPLIEDPEPIDVLIQWDGHALSASSITGLERLESGVAERFWKLIRQYGWWGLAYMEACLRLADHRASEQEEMEGTVHE
jgi:CRISPR-associated endonuclease/helicase Cas3